jgi:hypothetical protein
MVPKSPVGRFFYGMVHGVEHAAKWPVFRCQMCGQCALRTTGFTCSMRCPKQLRNGPCGGATNGRCETDSSKPCIWTMIYKRANSPLGRMFGQHKKIEKQFPSLDWRLYGTCAWINLVTGLIDINGHPNKDKIKQAFAKK